MLSTKGVSGEWWRAEDEAKTNTITSTITIRTRTLRHASNRNLDRTRTRARNRNRLNITSPCRLITNHPFYNNHYGSSRRRDPRRRRHRLDDRLLPGPGRGARPASRSGRLRPGGLVGRGRHSAAGQPAHGEDAVRSASRPFGVSVPAAFRGTQEPDRHRQRLPAL